MNITEIKNKILNVSIKSKNEVLFEGVAKSVSSQNDVGFFDILPMHTNYVTLIKEFVVLDKGLSTEKYIQIERGILTVVSDIVRVYAGI